MMHATGKRQLGPSDRGKSKGTSTDAAYMSLHKKPPSPLEASYKKPYRRWGCCSISSALIGLVFLVAVGVTLLYVFLFTDLVKHVTTGARTNGSTLAGNVNEDNVVVHPADGATTLFSPKPLAITTTPPPKLKDLNILVLVIDTRSHNIDGGAFKSTLDAWRRTEEAWKEMRQSNAISDRLTVQHCQTCLAIGLRDDDRGTTIFYTVQHLKGETHSFNMVVFVAQPTPPGEILATLTRYGRTDSLGDICQRGTWSATGCDFVVGGRDQKELRDRGHHQQPAHSNRNFPEVSTDITTSSSRTEKGGSSQSSFRMQALQTTEVELLKYDRTIVMQKDATTFKVLIHKPMAVR